MASYHWYDTPEYQLWQAASGGGTPAAPQPFRLTGSVPNSSGPYTAQSSTCDLIETGGENANLNAVGNTTIPWTYAAGSAFQLYIQAPTFSAGLLQLYYAELDITNLAGSQRLALGRDAARTITSGEAFFVAFDDVAEAGAQVGTDLVISEDMTTVTSTAGGVFVVSFTAQFIVAGLEA